MPKLTFVGAGSAVFARQVITDILVVEALDSGTFVLVDIDRHTLGKDQGGGGGSLSTLTKRPLYRRTSLL
jgi:hypothetical protein